MVLVKTALLDCINGNKNITLKNYRHQRTINLPNNAQTSSLLVANEAAVASCSLATIYHV